jgi:hypothetical protein
MRKLPIVLGVLVVIMSVGRGAWAFEFKEACSGRGYFISTSGNTPLAFTLIQTLHWTEPGAQRLDSLSETLNNNGVTCRYTLDTTQISSAVINPDGTGNSIASVVGAAGNPSTCAPSFTAHNSFAATISGSKFVSTDPGVVVDADCVNAP